MILIRIKYKFHACKNMGWFTHNNETNKEENGELENISTELKQNLAELECEEEIMQDKEDFGRVRTNMMRVLRAKHGDEIANRVQVEQTRELQVDI